MLVVLSIPFLYGFHTADIEMYPMYNDTDGDDEYDTIVGLSPADCFEQYDRFENPELLCPKQERFQRIDHGVFMAAIGGGIAVAVFGFGMVLAGLFTRYLIPEEADEQ